MTCCPKLPDSLRERATSEPTSALELATGVQGTVGEAIGELRELRTELATTLEELELRAAGAGTHPTAVWHEIAVSSAEHHREVKGSMRAPARREPTFALHVHVGVPMPAAAIGASTRCGPSPPAARAVEQLTVLAGPRQRPGQRSHPAVAGLPAGGHPACVRQLRRLGAGGRLLVRNEAFPDHSHLWWDVRLNPNIGTVEVRIMPRAPWGTQRRSPRWCSASCAWRWWRAERPGACCTPRRCWRRTASWPPATGPAPAWWTRARRSGRGAHPHRGALIACEPHASALGCTEELGRVRALLDSPGAQRQREAAGDGGDHHRLLRSLVEAFLAE